MKHFPAFVFSFLGCLTCFSQEAVVSLTKQNIVYLGIDNPVSAMVENLPCKSIFLQTDNGTIEKDPASHGNCDYLLRPEREGTAKIYVCRLYKKDTVIIGTLFTRAKYLPNPVAMIANQKGGTISKAILAAQPSLFAVLEGFSFDLRFNITGYTIIILRDEKALFVKHIDSGLITQEVKDAIMKTATNDEVIFLKITAEGPDKKPRNLNAIDFIIN